MPDQDDFPTQSEIFRHEIRDEAAFVALETAKLEGDIVRYLDREGRRKVTIWAIPGSETRRLQNDGALQEEVTLRDFSVPRQHGCACGLWECPLEGIDAQHESVLLFPPPEPKAPGTNNPSINAIVFYQNHRWSVDSWDCDSVEAKFNLHCIRHQPRGTSKL